MSVTADTANWAPPQTLTAVLLPAAQIARMATLLTPAALRVAEDLPDMDPAEAWAAVLVSVTMLRRSRRLTNACARASVRRPRASAFAMTFAASSAHSEGTTASPCVRDSRTSVA